MTFLADHYEMVKMDVQYLAENLSSTAIETFFARK
jgi:hypothetical protein